MISTEVSMADLFIRLYTQPPVNLHMVTQHTTVVSCQRVHATTRKATTGVLWSQCNTQCRCSVLPDYHPELLRTACAQLHALPSTTS